MDIRTRQSHADALMGAGLDQAAEILAAWIDTLGKNEHYRDGAEDALITLIQAGAADPRPEPEPEPTVVGIETDNGVAYYEV